MQIDPEVAAQKLSALLDKVPKLVGRTASAPEFRAWESEVKIVLKNLYGGESEEYSRFGSIWFIPGVYYAGQPKTDLVNALNRGLEEARLFLNSRKEEWDDRARPGTGKSPARGGEMARNRTDVFVVHGHNHDLKETVARFLVKLGLNPIILHEQPDRGSTIIEKFERHANVSFAIAIFSGDDIGISKEEIPRDGHIEPLMRPRARQNVVFEFGYFMGALGRKNVAAIVESGVETMSDYAGVLYIPFDAEDGWRLKLVKELKAAGLGVDANAAFK
ncbi:MAG: nucleotide-binding protein [Terriglobia bacterium]|jgi:predicted nucleotide-binding protein